MASCENCERMGKPTVSDEMSLQDQVVIEPFEKWALEFVVHLSTPCLKEEGTY